jgi:hypothetical protein
MLLDVASKRLELLELIERGVKRSLPPEEPVRVSCAIGLKAAESRNHDAERPRSLHSLSRNPGRTTDGRLAISPSYEDAVGGINFAARKRGVVLTEVVIDGKVNLHLAERDDYFLSARLNVKLLGVDRAIAVQLV